jgi:hypothetical protein
MTSLAASFLRRELLKPLVMACKCPDLTSEVGAHPFVPLVCDPFARSNAFIAFDKEGGKIAEDDQLVYLGEFRLSTVCLYQVVLDLNPQLLPSSDLVITPCDYRWVFVVCLKK